MRKTTTALLVAAYLGSIVIGVWAIQRFGIVDILGTGIMAPAAVYVIGVALVLRDLLQDFVGRRWMLLLIVAGAGLSAFVNPGLALASGAAFLVAETLDMLVYTPLRERSRLLGIAVSNAISIPVDSVIFLTLAFGSLQFLGGQMLGKAVGTVLAMAVIGLAQMGRERRPVLAV